MFGAAIFGGTYFGEAGIPNSAPDPYPIHLTLREQNTIRVAEANVLSRREANIVECAERNVVTIREQNHVTARERP